MGESLSDPYGDLMLIPCPPGIPVFVLLLLLWRFSGFQVVWTSLVHQDWKLEESGMSLGMSERFQVIGS